VTVAEAGGKHGGDRAGSRFAERDCLGGVAGCQARPHPVHGTVKLVGIPIKLAETPGEIRRVPPILNEHADEVLKEAGYAPAGIARATRNTPNEGAGIASTLPAANTATHRM